MHYKIEGAMRRNKTTFIVCSILWLFLVIVFVAPFSYSMFQAKIDGTFAIDIFIQRLTANITNPFGSLGGVLTEGATKDFV